MNCPFCKSTNLMLLQDTYCCDDCGGSFQVIQKPQPYLLRDVQKSTSTKVCPTCNGPMTDEEEHFMGGCNECEKEFMEKIE